MPFTKFADLDFDQIKTSIKTYLRANSNFTDFDFEGSNFSVLIDTLAYNTYITAFNSNMIVNESFLDSATIRDNVISLARNVGYVPRSKTCAKANISFNINLSAEATSPSQIILKAGLVCVGSIENTSYTFSIPEDIGTVVDSNSKIAAFNNIEICQGVFLTKEFVVNNSISQKFILDNPNIDTSTIIVKVIDSGTEVEYKKVDNILKIDNRSEIFLIQEIEDEKYEILFGDGILGKKLANGVTVRISYIVTDGIDGNGPSVFSYSGSITNTLGISQDPVGSVLITTNSGASGGGDIESIDSIKYFAPRVYSSQYRAVTAKDYEAIIQSVYPNTESVSVVGGEELIPPQYGNVFISIKPKNAYTISDFTKFNILSKLKQYSIIGINQKIIDLKLLYVEIDSSVYYNSSKISNVTDLQTKIKSNLDVYSKSVDLNKFGGRFKYSKILQIIDNSDTNVTSNITKVKIRRNLNCVISPNTFSQYELCFGNTFHKEIGKYNIKSTGFTISDAIGTVFFTDVAVADSNIGSLAIVRRNDSTNSLEIIKKSIGTVNYDTGEILINTIKITGTSLPNNIVEIQAYPDSNDVIGLKDLYVVFDVSKSSINMVKDTISSGEQISGVNFPSTSSYSNGNLTR
jgi:hypothetical protein